MLIILFFHIFPVFLKFFRISWWKIHSNTLKEIQSQGHRNGEKKSSKWISQSFSVNPCNSYGKMWTRATFILFSTITHLRVEFSTCHSYEDMWIWKSFSHVWIFAMPWTVALQAPLSVGILQARILEWVAIPPPGNLPNPGIKPRSPALQVDSLPSEPPGKPSQGHIHHYSHASYNCLPYLSYSRKFD